jgi:2-methylcitrate dehydratase
MPAPEAREYDPEIKDIADYVHNKAIDSELAVRPPRESFLKQNLPRALLLRS